jgi:hypothetical protein
MARMVINGRRRLVCSAAGVRSMAMTAAVRVTALTLIFVAPSCSDPTSVTEGDVEVIRDEGALLIHNRSGHRSLAHTFVEGETVPLILLAPCETWADPVPPGRSHRVPFEDVIGFTADSTVALFYWCMLDGDRVVAQGSFQVPLS